MKIKYSGVMFNPGKVERLLRTAKTQTINESVPIIKQATPVSSGDLRDSFDKDSNSIFSELYYSFYVEEGTRFFNGRFMIRDSIPDIEKVAVRNVRSLLP